MNCAHKLGKRILIDFSSPNIAKPFHFGHLKSTILGNFLANLHKYYGNQVTRLNYVGDWGTQYGLLSLGLNDNSHEQQYDKYSMSYLLECYVRANERAKQDQSFYAKARYHFEQLNLGHDEALVREWKKIRDISLDELKKSYERLAITFDVYEFESDYAKSCIDLVQQNSSDDQDSFATKQEDGLIVAQVMKNDKFHQVPLLKSDGTSLYLTRDIAAAVNRHEQYRFDKMLYVAGADQEKHFHYLKEIIKQLNHSWWDKIEHVKTGKVKGMSTRSGNFVLLSAIIDEATERFIESTKNVPTSKVRKEIDISSVGKQLALSALFVYDLRNKRTKSYDFNWNSVMAATNRSGLNMQATYARLCSLHRRSLECNIEPDNSNLKLESYSLKSCVEADELISVMKLSENALQEALETSDASPVIHHTFELCNRINRARQTPSLTVINEDDKSLAASRLSMFEKARARLEFLIRLIGLSPLERI